MGFKAELDKDARNDAREVFKRHRTEPRFGSTVDTVRTRILADVLTQQIENKSEITLHKLFSILEACYIESNVDWYRDRVERRLYRKLKKFDND
jgi:hypothetical protein